MNRKRRVIIEVFAPSFLGTVLWYGGHIGELAHTGALNLLDFSIYWVLAFLFALVPSLVYALVMEWWFGRGLLDRARRISAVALSTALGFGAGYFVFRASEARVIWLGGAVGLILGVVLGLGAKDESPREPQPAVPAPAGASADGGGPHSGAAPL